MRCPPPHVGLQYTIMCVYVCAAKNLALMGVRSLTLYDPSPVTLSDLSAQVASPLPFHVSSLFTHCIGCGRGPGCGCYVDGARGVICDGVLALGCEQCVAPMWLSP